MPYLVKHNGVGPKPWLQGDELTDEEFEAYPLREKALRTGAVVKMDASERGKLDAADKEQRIAELSQQIAALTAELNALQGHNVEPHAPAMVSVQMQTDPDDQPGRDEAAAIRKAGQEVIQPTPGEINLGTRVPGEAAEETPGQARARHMREVAAKRRAEAEQE